MKHFDLNEWSCDLVNRRVTYQGYAFDFYEYETAEDWQQAEPIGWRVGSEFTAAAKAVALAFGMKHRKS